MKLKGILAEVLSNDVVFHGTDGKFTSFHDHDPIFFSDNIKVAKSYGSTIIKAKLTLDNPLEIDCEGNSTIRFLNKHYLPSDFAKLIKGISNDIKTYGIDDEMREELDQYDWSDNYGDLDGIVMKNIKDSSGDIFAGDIVANNYVVFNTTQIKKI